MIVETARLRHFCVLVETGSFRGAAELLQMSHGGLSKSIKALEDDLGVKLTIPAGRGVAISEAGERLYTRGRRLLEEVEQLPGFLRDETEPSALRIGSFEVFTTYFFGRLAAEYLSDTPLRLLEVVPGEIEEALRSKRIDIGLTYTPVPRPGIDFLRVGSLRMGIFKRRGAFERTAFAELPFAAPLTTIAEASGDARSLDLWPTHLFPRRVVYNIELMESGLELCRQGVAAMFVPDFVIRLHNEQHAAKYRLVEHPAPKKMARVTLPIYIAKRNASPETSAIKKVAKAIRMLARVSGTSSPPR